MTVLAVIHQPESIFFQAARVLVLEQGKLLFDRTPQNTGDFWGGRFLIYEHPNDLKYISKNLHFICTKALERNLDFCYTYDS